MAFTIISTLVFTSIIVLLVLILNIAEKNLLPQGDVSILINDEPDKAITVGTGGTLLGACLLYTSPSPRDATLSRMPSSA